MNNFLENFDYETDEEMPGLIDCYNETSHLMNLYGDGKYVNDYDCEEETATELPTLEDQINDLKEQLKELKEELKELKESTIEQERKEQERKEQERKEQERKEQIEESTIEVKLESMDRDILTPSPKTKPNCIIC